MKFPHTSTRFIEQHCSFESWQHQVAQCQAQLSQSPQQSFLLFESDSYQFSILFFALIAANKRIILPQNGQDQQLLQCMAHADAYLGSSKVAGLKHFEFTELALENTNVSLDFAPDTTIVFYTSGSSGEAKAIEKTFEQLITEIGQLEQSFSAQLEQVIVMSTVSHQHIYGLLFKLLWPIWCGRDVYLGPFEYPEHLVHQVKQLNGKKVCLISSPAYYHRLIKDNVLIEIKHQIAALFSSGGPLELTAALSLGS